MNFQNKFVLITGGSRGIGRATALAFALKGATVAINYLENEAAALATIEALPPGDHLALKADVANPEAVRRLINRVVEEWGQLDIVVNNAAIFSEHAIDKVSYESWQNAWRDILDVNLIGVANICYCAVQYMIARGGGRIINVSSRGAYRGEPEFPAYGASKGGLNALTQSLAKAVGKYNIFVNAVAPGFVETDMAKPLLNGKEGAAIRAQSPLNRVAKPEEVAHAILFLASEKAAFSTGAIVDLNGASYFR